jgi:hypothetical protein
MNACRLVFPGPQVPELFGTRVHSSIAMSLPKSSAGPAPASTTNQILTKRPLTPRCRSSTVCASRSSARPRPPLVATPSAQQPRSTWTFQSTTPPPQTGGSTLPSDREPAATSLAVRPAVLPLLSSAAVAKLITWGAISIELGIVVCAMAGGRARRTGVALAVVLHGGIAVTTGLIGFGLIMMALVLGLCIGDRKRSPEQDEGREPLEGHGASGLHPFAPSGFAQNMESRC